MTDDRRAARLKAALRENLKRRKAQSRGRAGADRPAGSPPEPAPDDGAEPPPKS
jgi:hypothetical protein